MSLSQAELEELANKIINKFNKYTVVNNRGNETTVNQLKLVIGSTYIIKPVNPQKLKHRDQVCTLIKILKSIT